MREWLVMGTEKAVVVIQALAILTIVFATLRAFVAVLPLMLSPKPTRTGEIWIPYARWLIAGLTFLLAADIIETTIHTSWESIGQLGAIAVIRTFLNYFLERDVTEISEKMRAAPPSTRQRHATPDGEEAVISRRSR